MNNFKESIQSLTLEDDDTPRVIVAAILRWLTRCWMSSTPSEIKGHGL